MLRVRIPVPIGINVLRDRVKTRVALSELVVSSLTNFRQDGRSSVPTKVFAIILTTKTNLWTERFRWSSD